jgi:hypothetical protein
MHMYNILFIGLASVFVMTWNIMYVWYIRTNVFSIHAIPMWEANIDVQYVLDPYFVIVCYTFYLTKVNKSITQEM